MNINVELLERVKAAILEEPRRVSMDDWGINYPDISVQFDDDLPPCGTVACIAGWAAKLSGDTLFSEGFQRIIPPPEEIWKDGHLTPQGVEWDAAQDRLCYVGSWPHDLRDELKWYDIGTKGYAEVVAKRIDRFIKANGEE